MEQVFKIQWVGSPNYRQGRDARVPVAIVNHITAGAFPGCLEWLQNPVAKASAHYLVTRAGRILQLVKDEDTAWHAGGVHQPSWSLYDGTNPNRYTIGIEHEGMAGDAVTALQYQATLWLHGQLVEKWVIPCDQEHIIGHYRIDSINRPNCPGPGFPWDRLFLDLKGRNKPMPSDWKLTIVQDARAAGLITADHDPDDLATKWFVLAVALNLLKVVKGA